jgi:putative ABC transport system permease protein
MFKNYLKVAFRYLTRHKGYTFINILGLSVGIACCILIALFVRSEWSFNRFHPNSERIHRAWLEEFYQGEIFRNTVTPIPLVPVLQAGIPEIESSCRIASMRPPVKYNNNIFNEEVNMVDSTFFKIFHFPLIEGNKQDPFSTSSSLVISERASKRYFGNESPIGKNLELELGGEKVLFTITALAKDPPMESNIQFDMVIPFSNAPYIWNEQTRNSAWSNVAVSSFFLLQKGASVENVNQKAATILQPLVAKNYKPGEYNVRMQPLEDIYFNATLPEGEQGYSDPKYSYILGTVGILILLIACINFVTLSVGRSATRAMEVGVRKVLGAERKQLIRQFWGESILLTLIALIIGFLLALASLKHFNQLANRELFLSLNSFTLLFSVILIVVIGFISGFYPAIVLSGFKPIQVLKGKLNIGNNMGFFRKALIVGQFAASIIMIICTLTVGKQLNYLRSKNLGFDKEHVIIVPTNKSRIIGNSLGKRLELVIQQNPKVISTTTSMFSMAQSGWMSLGYSDDQGSFRQFRFNAIDEKFIPAMGLQVVEGRNFLKDNTADSNKIIVNEALVKQYGWKDPIGQKLPGKYPQQVVGVVKDFHFESLHTPIAPLVMALKPDSMFAYSSDMSYNASPQPRVSVRFREGDVQEHIKNLEAAWKSVAADENFEFRFLDEALAASYEQEQRLGNIVKYASFLSIFIACMGLFGLATLVVVRRTKEIGIRKVLGASVPRIVTLLSKDFVVLVIVASVIAFPIAWWALSKWMEDFAYRIDIPWWIFITAAVLALVVALVTVSAQAIKAALTNPVKSLRTE